MPCQVATIRYNTFWLPYQSIILRSLEFNKPATSLCKDEREVEETGDKDVIVMENLEPFSEYRIQVDASLDFFNSTSSTIVVGRTS